MLVAPLTRSVDWNRKCVINDVFTWVAPLTRSVDWNWKLWWCNREPDRSLLSRGAWIEMVGTNAVPLMLLSLLSRGAWIEISFSRAISAKIPSLLSRGAWIEIELVNVCISAFTVAPLTRSVDWNIVNGVCIWAFDTSLLSRGAWIEILSVTFNFSTPLSLLSRGAWIEIIFASIISPMTWVAPLTRSVDWNSPCL